MYLIHFLLLLFFFGLFVVSLRMNGKGHWSLSPLWQMAAGCVLIAGTAFNLLEVDQPLLAVTLAAGLFMALLGTARYIVAQLAS